jgi:guanine deaminase
MQQVSYLSQLTKYMDEVVTMALENVQKNHSGPFAAIVVKDGQIIGRGTNLVTQTNDPTAHAEIVALRQAAQALSDFNLAGCKLYTSCYPCPMCLGAVYWSRIDKVYYANTPEDAARAGFDDQIMYQEFNRPDNEKTLSLIRVEHADASKAMDAWIKLEDKIPY